MTKGIAKCAVAVMAILLCGEGASLSQSDPVLQSPALAGIKKRRAIRLGYRDSSPPFSFLDRAGRPIGYSIDLCQSIAAEVGAAIDEPDVPVEYVKVTSSTRIEAVGRNEIDFECGSTTANAERAQSVAFSPVMFIAGTKLMVPKASPINAPEDLRRKRVAVTLGTTNEAVMRRLNEKLALELALITGKDHEDSYQLMATGQADAFATDDILLYGLIARHKAQNVFRVTSDYLSYEPYGIMFSKGDAELKAIVERSFRTLASNHDLIPLYKKWFEGRLPTGEKLGIPISPQLEESFKVLDATEGTNN